MRKKALGSLAGMQKGMAGGTALSRVPTVEFHLPAVRL